MKVFGPVSITHSGVDLGKTYKGGSYQFTSIRKRKAGPTPTFDSIVVGGNGAIKLFEIAQGIVISDNLVFKEYGPLVFTSPDIVITIHNAKIFLPEKLEFGTSILTTFDLDFVFSADSQGRLVTLTNP